VDNQQKRVILSLGKEEQFTILEKMFI